MEILAARALASRELSTIGKSTLFCLKRERHRGLHANALEAYLLDITKDTPVGW